MRIRIREIAQVRVSYGYKPIHALLIREGWRMNHKRVYRLYKEEGLMLRRHRPRRRVAAKRREEQVVAQAVNESWSMDFVSDQLFDGRRIRVLTLFDNFIRPGKPTDNALTESFNESFRHESLNQD